MSEPLVAFCWLCGNQLYQRKIKQVLMIDGHQRVLHKQCAKEVRTSGDYKKTEEYHSLQWVASEDER